MAHEIPIASDQCHDDVDLEKGIILIRDPAGDSDEIHGLSSPTTTAVDDASECKASNEQIMMFALLTLTGSDKSGTSEAAIPFIITKACKLHSPFGLIFRAYHMTVESFPVGYPLQAAFQSSEPSFSIYRSFSYLHSRVLLQLQDELRSLEDNLEKLDGRDSSREERGDCVTSREADLMQAKRDRKPSERANLLTQICDRLQRYDEILLKAREAVPKRGYYYRSWLTIVHLVAMAKDLDLDEHLQTHEHNKPCGTMALEECATKTRVWHVLFAIELIVGGPQGQLI